MTESTWRSQRLLATCELPAVLLVAWAVFVSIPLVRGGLGLSWDAMNHHIYLGWVAEAARFDRDFLAASYQSYQYPVVYWPVYKLAMGGASGIQAGVVLATLNLLLVPPVWMLARTCMPGRLGFDVLMRMMAVLLAFMTGVILLLFDSTSNDLLAAAPMMWAVAFAMTPLDEARGNWLTARRSILLSGVFAGVSIAFKLSNGPLAVLLPGLWLFSANSWRARVGQVCAGSLAMTIGWLLAYGYWGWQLWTHFGNPIYPFYDELFAPLRHLLGWSP